MPVENSWLVENRVLLTRLIGKVTVEEMIESSHRGTGMIESGVAPVYSLVDLTQLTHFPTKLNELRRISQEGKSAKMRMVILYAIPNPFVSFLASAFTQFADIHYKVVQTEADALALVDRLERSPLSRLRQSP